MARKNTTRKNPTRKPKAGSGGQEMDGGGNPLMYGPMPGGGWMKGTPDDFGVKAKVPRKFWDDHVARDANLTGVEQGLTKSHAKVWLDKRAYDDLLSDARYYGDKETAAQMGMSGLRDSARATIKVLQKLRGIGLPWD